MESHVFSWSRESESFFLNCWSRSRESESGFQKCWSRSRFFKTVGVGFSKLLESESGVGVGILKNLPTPQPWLQGLELISTPQKNVAHSFKMVYTVSNINITIN